MERGGESRGWRSAGSATALLAGALLALTPGCRDPCPAPLRLGFLGGISTDLGAAGRDGALFAVEERNASGGLAGRPVELLVRDSRQQPAVAAEAVHSLAAAGALAIIGPMTSAIAEAALPAAESEGIVLLSPTVSSNELSGLDDRFFRVYPPSRMAAELLAAHVLQGLHKSRVTALSDQGNRAHTESWLEGFTRAFEHAGGEVAGVARFTSGPGTEFYPLAEAALAPGPDCVFVLANATDTAALCQHLRLQGFAGPIVTSEWSTGPDLLLHGGRAVDGLQFLKTFDPGDPSPRFRGFSEAFVRRFGYVPGFAAVHAYDAVGIVLSSLQPPFGRQGLERALRGKDSFQGLQGPIRFDAFGDPLRRHFLMTVEHGEFLRLAGP